MRNNIKKTIICLLSFACASIFGTGLAVTVSANSVGEKPAVTNVALNLPVKYTAFDGTSLKAKPFAPNTDVYDNILTVETGEAYEWLRFHNGVELFTDEDEAATGWAVLDLGVYRVIEGVGTQFWNDWSYTDVVIQIARSEDFSDACTVYNNDADDSLGFGAGRDGGYTDVFTELAEVKFDPYVARYVRVTSNAKGEGYSLFSRIEVYGRELKNEPVSPVEVVGVTADKKSGLYANAFNVTLSTVYDGATVYYTTDGSWPTTSSKVYEGPVDLSGLGKEVMLRAAVCVNGVLSIPSDFVYTFASTEKEEEPAYETGVNYAYGKTATAYKIDGGEINVLPLNGGQSLDCVTDGVKGTDNSIQLEGLGWIQIDMGKQAWFNKVFVMMWHDWVFRSIIVQISETEDFSTGVTTVVSTNVGSWVSSTPAGSLDSNFDYNREWISHKEQSADGGFTFNFEPVHGRYIRFTNQSGSGSYYTVCTEIEAWTCAEPGSEPVVLERAIYAADLESEIGVANGTSLAEVIAKLPSIVNITDNEGDVYAVAGIWNCADYSPNAGKYVFGFTANDKLPAVDAYGLLKVTVAVEEPADLTALNEVIKKAKDLKEVDYTTSTWANEAKALTTAESVVAADRKRQEEVDDAALALENAMKALEERADVASLSELTERVKVKAENDYTASTYALFKEALDNAQRIVADNSDVNQKKADDANNALAKADSALVACAQETDFAAFDAKYEKLLNGLENENAYTLSSVAAVREVLEKTASYYDLEEDVRREMPANRFSAQKAVLDGAELVARGDVTALKAQYDAYAEELGTDGTDTKGYHIASWCKYVDYMEKVNAVLGENGNADKNEADIAEMLAELKSIRENMVAYADRKDFDTLWNTVENADETFYTTGSWAALLSAKNEVKAVYELRPEYSEQATIDAAYETLNTAYEALVARGDKATLNQYISSYSVAEAENYTASTYNAFNDCLAAAVLAKTDNALSQEEVDAIAIALDEAYHALVALGNKTALSAMLERAANVTTDDETKAKDLAAAIAYADAVKVSNEVTQEDVDEATGILRTAINNITGEFNKTADGGCKSSIGSAVSLCAVVMVVATLVFARKKREEV